MGGGFLMTKFMTRKMITMLIALSMLGTIIGLQYLQF